MTSYISTRTGRWHAVEWDAASKSWHEVASGPVVVETSGAPPRVGGAYLPDDQQSILQSGPINEVMA